MTATLGMALVASALLLLLAPRATLSPASAGAAATAQALVHGSVVVVDAVPDAFATVVRNGHRYVAQPIGPALLFVPAALLRLERPARLAVAHAICAALLGGLLLALFFRRARAGSSSPSSATWATLLLLATFAGFAGREGDGTVLAALTMFVFADGAARSVMATKDELSALGIFAVGLCGGVWSLCEPAAAPLLLVGAALVVVGPLTRLPATTPWPIVLAKRAALLAVGLLPLTLVAWWHARLIAPPPLPADVLLGLDGLLLSTGKSVFLYAPPLFLLPLAWRARGFFLRLTLALLVIVPVAATVDWHGDPAWGPARIAGVVPLLLLLLVPWLDGAWGGQRRGTGALLGTGVAVGLAVQLVGCAMAPGSYLHLLEGEKNRTGASGWFAVAADQAHFIPQFSPLGGHAWLLRHLVRRDRHLDRDPPWVLITPAPAHLEDDWATLYIDYLAVDAAGGNGAIDRDLWVRALWGGAVAGELALGLLLWAARRRTAGHRS